MPQFADYHRTVIGFHGTTRKTAERIVLRGSFTPSRNNDDWLGNGVYFWEYAPQQAAQWAKQRYSEKTRIAVVAAMIRLGNCFDLLDPRNVEPLIEAKKALIKTVKPLPQNHNSNKYLDCAVFETLYQLQESAEEPIDTARAVYVPTEAHKRIWKRSWIYKETHVQLCVRNSRNILGTWLVKETDES